MKAYAGWRDLGPRRRGRVWKFEASIRPSGFVRPPFVAIVSLLSRSDNGGAR